MNRLEFIQQLFILTRTQGINNDLLRVYDRALQTPYDVDFDKMFTHITKVAETRALQAPKYYADKLKQFKVEDEYTKADKGAIVLVEFKNGRTIDFIVTGYGTNTKELRYNKDIKKVLMLPSDTSIIGGEIVNLDEIDKSKIKLLYDCNGRSEVCNNN